jgi:hypothetical protein
MIVFVGTNEQVVETARRLHALHHVCHRLVDSSAMPHRLSYTRAYVSKKPHVHARRHTCRSSVAGPGLQAPCDIRPRPLTNPEPHTCLLRAPRPLHLARARIMAGSWAWGHMHAASCSRASGSASAGPGRTQARPAKASALPGRTQAKASRAPAKETRPHHGKSADSGEHQQK